MASASDHRAHAALQPADCLILLPQRLPAAVETSIGPAHYPAECTQSDAFLQPSLRARNGRANSNSFRRFAGSYVAAHGAAMLPSHRRAIADIIACRTEALGRQQWCCNHCGTLLHVFHSCRNRACPKCHAEQTRAWLEQRREEMLPVPYFHVTVTVPEELRAALRRYQIEGYGALMKAAAEAIIVLARDPRWVGGTVGVLAVLHTWTQRLIFHPHVHCLVTGGGLSDDGTTWHPAGKTFL